ncbi:unnamed protein product, partial [Rotaria sp. Silwood2]
MKYLRKMFNYLMDLPKFYSLIISIDDYIESLDLLFFNLFNLLTLKYCKIEYETKNFECQSLIYLIINGRFSFKSLNNVLCCLPKLRHLSINALVHCRDYFET